MRNKIKALFFVTVMTLVILLLFQNCSEFESINGEVINSSSIDIQLPQAGGQRPPIIETISAVSYTHLTLPTTPYV